MPQTNGTNAAPTPSRGGRFRPMFAKFNGVCEECSGRVARGSRGVYDTKARRFYHFACAVDARIVEPDNTPERAADRQNALSIKCNACGFAPAAGERIYP